MIIFTQKALESIGEHIASYEPERGGALMMLADSNIVAELIPDPQAQVSGSSYLPSSELTQRIQQHERTTELRFGGIIHSHPNGMSSPSGQDHRAFALGLAINPALGGFVAPIVTVGKDQGPLGDHEVALHPRGKMTLYTAFRPKYLHEEISPTGSTHNPLLRRGSSALGFKKIRRETSADPRDMGIELCTTDVGIIPIESDLKVLVHQLNLIGFELLTDEFSYSGLNGSPFIGRALKFETFEALLLFPIGYPFVPPFCMFTPSSGNTAQIVFAWEVDNSSFRLNAVFSAMLHKLEKTVQGGGVKKSVPEPLGDDVRLAPSSKQDYTPSTQFKRKGWLGLYTPKPQTKGGDESGS